jgi:membrane protein
MWITLKNIVQFGRRVYVRIDEERLNQAAASLTFTTVLALVPLATVALAIFTVFPMFLKVRTALQDYFLESLMPAAISETVMGFVNGFADKARGLTVIGLIFLLVSALAMMLTVEQSMNQIWRTSTRAGLATRLLAYWGALTLGPLLLGVSLYVTALAAAKVSNPNLFGPLSELLLWAVPVVLAAASWALVYRTVPHTKVVWKHAWIGALVAALLFEVVKRGFAAYLSGYANYKQLYGAFSVVPIFLLWLYLCWLITLAGAVVAALAPTWGQRQAHRVARVGDVLADCLDVLRCLNRARVTEPFTQDFEQIVTVTVLPRNAVQDALALLQSLQWVAVLKLEGEDAERYSLIADPQTLTLKPLLDKTTMDADHPKLALFAGPLGELRQMKLAQALV